MLFMINGDAADGSDLLRYDEVAMMLRVSERTIRRMVSVGQIPALHVGRQRFILREEVTFYIEQKRAKHDHEKRMQALIDQRVTQGDAVWVDDHWEAQDAS